MVENSPDRHAQLLTKGFATRNVATPPTPNCTCISSHFPQHHEKGVQGFFCLFFLNKIQMNINLLSKNAGNAI